MAPHADPLLNTSLPDNPSLALTVSGPLSLDIDHLIRLAACDIAAFDSVAKDLIEEALSRSACNEMLLRRLQFRIDSVKRKARTPLQSCLRVSEMMWDSFLAMNACLQKRQHQIATDLAGCNIKRFPLAKPCEGKMTNAFAPPPVRAVFHCDTDRRFETAPQALHLPGITRSSRSPSEHLPPNEHRRSRF